VEEDLDDQETELLHSCRQNLNLPVESLAIKQAQQLADISMESDLRDLDADVEAARDAPRARSPL
jgi:hypothetical protein